MQTVHWQSSADLGVHRESLRLSNHGSSTRYIDLGSADPVHIMIGKRNIPTSPGTAAVISRLSSRICMDFLLPTVLRAALGHPPKLVCEPVIWNEGVNELRRRSAGQCESGAFLLGQNAGRMRKIEGFLFYDDVDPHCFDHGIVEFDGGKFGMVWQQCRLRKKTVVADVHVHPGHYTQSGSDRHNPMIPEAGHLALIIPNFATQRRTPGHIGIYEYLGARQWHNHSRNGKKIFYVGWWPW